MEEADSKSGVGAPNLSLDLNLNPAQRLKKGSNPNLKSG